MCVGTGSHSLWVKDLEFVKSIPSEFFSLKAGANIQIKIVLAPTNIRHSEKVVQNHARDLLRLCRASGAAASVSHEDEQIVIPMKGQSSHQIVTIPSSRYEFIMRPKASIKSNCPVSSIQSIAPGDSTSGLDF